MASASVMSATSGSSSPLHHHHQEDDAHAAFTRDDLRALDIVDQPIWIFDIVRRGMWYANKAAVQLWSASSLEDLLARDFKKDMSESTIHRLDDYLLKFSSDDDHIIKEQWTFYPNGLGPKTVDCRCKGIPIEEGRLAMLVQGRYKELTTEAEQEALRAVEMLRHLPVAVCLTDMDGNILEQNPEALAVFGSIGGDDNKTIASNDSDFSSSGGSSSNNNKEEESAFVKRFVDTDLGRRVLEQAKSGKDVQRLEALQHTVHGPRWSAIQVRQTKDPVTSKPILLYSARDVTAVVEAKRQAVAADMAKMDLLADMAHAIRTPLQHVVGVVELLSRDSSTSDWQTIASGADSRHTNLLRSSARLLMTVLKDLMDNVCTVNDGNRKSPCGVKDCMLDHAAEPHNHHHVKLDHAQINVQNVLDSAVATITPHAEAKDLWIKAQVSKNLQKVALMGDAKRLGQILFEILHNAIKYTSRGGVAITLRRLSKRQARRVRVRFEVKDTGVGLNLEQQRQCLQTKKSKKTDLDAGVGLSLCKSLVEAMGGTIGVDSKPSCGATFWFEIPFLRAPTTNIGCSKEIPSSSSPPLKPQKQRSLGSLLDTVPDDDDGAEQGGLQILLVDANTVGRNVMTALLEQSGHSVTTADNGTSMAEAVAQNSFDVVLLETQLPSCENEGALSSLEAIRQIRSMGHTTENLPILALTAAVPRADYPELGLNDWLTKPMMIKDIQKAMTNAICNVGTKSTETGSIFTAEETQSLDSSGLSGRDSLDRIGSCHTLGRTGSVSGRGSLGGRGSGHSLGRGSGHTFGRGSGHDGPASLPRRESFGTVHSAFSSHLQAAMGILEDGGEPNTPPVEAQPPLSVGRLSPTPAGEKTDKPPKMIRRGLSSG